MNDWNAHCSFDEQRLWKLQFSVQLELLALDDHNVNCQSLPQHAHGRLWKMDRGFRWPLYR